MFVDSVCGTLLSGFKLNDWAATDGIDAFVQRGPFNGQIGSVELAGSWADGEVPLAKFNRKRFLVFRGTQRRDVQTICLANLFDFPRPNVFTTNLFDKKPIGQIKSELVPFGTAKIQVCSPCQSQSVFTNIKDRFGFRS